MKISFVSDVHYEFYKRDIKIPIDSDVIILAGDIHITPLGAVKFIKKIRAETNIPILYVIGNHEYYLNNFPSILSEYKNLIKRVSDVKILEKKSAIINNVKFIGLTLWSDLSNKIDYNNALICMPDYKYIRTGRGTKTRPLIPTDTTKEWEYSKEWLISKLQKEFSGKTVVISHHSPSKITINKYFTNDKINKCFHSDLDDIINTYQPDVWIYGHDHTKARYQMGKTLLISHPIGYSKNCKTITFKTIEI